jgi:hypothetical protein
MRVQVTEARVIPRLSSQLRQRARDGVPGRVPLPANVQRGRQHKRRAGREELDEAKDRDGPQQGGGLVRRLRRRLPSLLHRVRLLVRELPADHLGADAGEDVMPRATSLAITRRRMPLPMKRSEKSERPISQVAPAMMTPMAFGTASVRQDSSSTLERSFSFGQHLHCLAETGLSEDDDAEGGGQAKFMGRQRGRSPVASSRAAGYGASARTIGTERRIRTRRARDRQQGEQRR